MDWMVFYLAWYYILEGGANLWWWAWHPVLETYFMVNVFGYKLAVPIQMTWEMGRILRIAVGLILILHAIYS